MGSLFRRAQAQQVQQENSMLEEQQKISIILRDGVTKIEEQALMSRDDLKHLFEHLDFDRQDLHYPYALSLIKCCKGVVTFYVAHQSDGMFLMYIKPITFPHLKKLSLFNCHLVSIQNVTCLLTPNLKELCLRDNNITSVRPLLKVTSDLEIINLRQNKIIQMELLYMVNFSSNSVALNLQEHNQDYYGEKVNWLFKMPFRTIERIQIDGKGRIPVEKSIPSKIKKIYNGQTEVFLWGPKVKKEKVPEVNIFNGFN